MNAPRAEHDYKAAWEHAVKLAATYRQTLREVIEYDRCSDQADIAREALSGSHGPSHAAVHPVKDRHHHRRPQPSMGELARDLSLALRVLVNAEKARQPTGEREEILGYCENALARYSALYPDPYEAVPRVY